MVLDPAIADVGKQLAQTDDEIRKKMPSRAENMLKVGITCARDLGGGNWLELELRDRIARGEIPRSASIVCRSSDHICGGTLSFLGWRSTQRT